MNWNDTLMMFTGTPQFKYILSGVYTPFFYYELEYIFQKQ